MKVLAFLLVLAFVSVQGFNRKNKKGRCPQLIDFEMGLECSNPCKSDGDCIGNEKCCLSDCRGNECIKAVDETPDTMCRIACPKILSPVCGTDGVTYPNWCSLNFTSCSRNQNWIKKAYEGACQEEEIEVGCQSSNGEKGPCASELKDANKQGLIGAKRPQCDENGFYLPRQCHASTGFCWCSDCYGNQLTKPIRGGVTEESCMALRKK